jgi:hypothetical protein
MRKEPLTTSSGRRTSFWLWSIFLLIGLKIVFPTALVSEFSDLFLLGVLLRAGLDGKHHG